MVGEPAGTNAGAGTGSAPGSGGAGAGAAGAGAGGGGEGGSGSGSGTPPSGATGLDRSRLNPMLAAMNEDQLNEVFDTLFAAARDKSSGIPEHARQQETVERPKQPSKDELKEYFDPSSEKFDPMAVITSLVETNYGGLLGDINKRAMAGAAIALKGQFPDLDEYMGDMNKILEATGKPASAMSQNDLIAAYYMAKGARTTQAEIKERQKPAKTVPPGPQGGGESGEELPKADQLSQEEIDVAKIMYRNSADPVAEFRKVQKRANEWKLKVPGDKS